MGSTNQVQRMEEYLFPEKPPPHNEQTSTLTYQAAFVYIGIVTDDDASQQRSRDAADGEAVDSSSNR